MAWLSGLTGKAESFLNSLDQTAAKVLHEKEDQGLPVNTKPTGIANVQGHTPFLSQKASSITPAQSVPAKLHDYQEAETGLSAKSKSDASSVKKRVDKDEALFEFLNSPEPTERRKSTPASSQRHSRQSSSSSVISNKGGRGGDNGSSISTSGSSMVHVEMQGKVTFYV